MPHLIVPVNENDHIRGPSDAPVTLVEYGDYQCPICQLTVPIIEQLQKELEGQFRFVFRHFPLKYAHPLALIAAQAAEAAAQQNKFWQMHNLLYLNQLQLSEKMLNSLDTQLQLDGEKFKSALQSQPIYQHIEDDFMSGVRSGVNGTPCFFINGERYDGDRSYESLKEALLNSAKSP